MRVILQGISDKGIGQLIGCRDLMDQGTTPLRRLCRKVRRPVDVPACMTSASVTNGPPRPPTMHSFEVGDGPAEAFWRQMGDHCR
jgi:hypothetical protein